MKSTTAFTRLLVVALLATVFVLGVASAQAREAQGTEDEQKVFFDVGRYTSGWITSDSNGDGLVDYALKLTDRLQKEVEAMDFSNDGYMDNFYYYENDVLVRHELDTNGNQQIDLWVFMYRGVQVRGWERDTNHDGEADLFRSYE